MDIQVNWGALQAPDFVVEVVEWQGKEMSKEYITETIQQMISELENDEDKGDSGDCTYTLCGDTMIVITRENNLLSPDTLYTVNITKLTHRGFVKRG